MVHGAANVVGDFEGVDGQGSPREASGYTIEGCALERNFRACHLIGEGEDGLVNDRRASGARAL